MFTSRYIYPAMLYHNKHFINVIDVTLLVGNVLSGL